MERPSNMSNDNQDKAELYQIMLICCATALKCFHQSMRPEESVEAADQIIQAAQRKAQERYGK